MENEPKQNIAEKLQQELLMRSSYYFEGFGFLIGVDLLSNLELFLIEKTTEQRAEAVRNYMKKIIEYYASIPFDQIKDHPDYDIFSAVKDAIAELKTEVNQILVGRVKDMDKANQIILFILDKGNEYRDRLVTIRDELRKNRDLDIKNFKPRIC